MRQGSYAQDEFGQGIVDPDYRLENDTSPILCPGSEFHGPPFYFNGLKLWDKQGRERAQERPVSAGVTFTAQGPQPSLPPGRIRRLRFYGPFADAWIVALDDERIIEDIVPGPNVFDVPGWPPDPYVPRPVVREQRLTASFELTHPIRNPSREWLEQNIQDVHEQQIRMSEDTAMTVEMSPVVIPFRSFSVYSHDPGASEPDWIEFETSYQIERHPWFMQMWTVAGTAEDVHLRPVSNVSNHLSGTAMDLNTPSVPSPQPREGIESDYVVIDEVHTMTNERLRHHVEDAQSRGSRPPSQEAFEEAYRRRQAVLRGGTEDPSSRD